MDFRVWGAVDFPDLVAGFYFFSRIDSKMLCGFATTEKSCGPCSKLAVVQFDITGSKVRLQPSPLPGGPHQEADAAAPFHSKLGSVN